MTYPNLLPYQRLRQREHPIILLAETDPETIRILIPALESINCLVEVVNDGAEAIQAYARLEPDMVMFALQLPGLDGLGLCRSLLERYGNECAPLVALTEWDDEAGMEAAFMAGAFDCFRKPFFSKLITQRTARLLYQQIFQRATEQRNVILETLNWVSRAASSALTLDDILERVVYITGHALEADIAFICDVNALEDSTTVLAEYRDPRAVGNLPKTELGKSYSISEEFAYLSKWLQGKEDFVVIQLEEVAISSFERKHYQAYGVQTIVIVRLKAKDKLIGYIEYWYQSRFTLPQVQANFIITAASQVAMIIHNAMLHHKAQRYLTELEERNQELDAYAHTIAHDLKNPLQLILNYSDITRLDYADILPPEGQLYLTRTIEAGYKMADMIENLLQLAYLRDAVAEARPVMMQSVAAVALGRFDHILREKSVQVKLADEMPASLGHTPWLEEVWANLIGNALKYIGEDNPKPTLALRGYRHAQMIRYEVEDNGIGIKPEEQERLFQMFSRLSNVGNVKGFGLGLSIVHRIVTKLGGKVGVQSEWGKGSTFWFELSPAD